jgi:hypothetical protein
MSPAGQLRFLAQHPVAISTRASEKPPIADVLMVCTNEGDAAMPTTPTTHATLIAIRAAYHPEATPSYDRVVFEFNGQLPPLRIEYVKSLIADGSGLPVPIAGRAILLVQFTSTQAHGDTGQATAPNHMAPNLPLVKAIVSAGDFEGVVTYGIGLARKVDTRMLTMEAPNRLVIDFLG